MSIGSMVYIHGDLTLLTRSPRELWNKDLVKPLQFEIEHEAAETLWFPRFSSDTVRHRLLRKICFNERDTISPLSVLLCSSARFQCKAQLKQRADWQNLDKKTYLAIFENDSTAVPHLDPWVFKLFLMLFKGWNTVLTGKNQRSLTKALPLRVKAVKNEDWVCTPMSDRPPPQNEENHYSQCVSVFQESLKPNACCTTCAAEQ